MSKDRPCDRACDHVCAATNRAARASVGVATSDDGIRWQRGSGVVQGTRKADDVGACLQGNDENWWTLDTMAVALGDVQLFSSDMVHGGAGGVYWMFYTGIDYQPVAAPEGLAGLPAGKEVEGLCARPGLAMSQVRCKMRGCQMHGVRYAQRGCQMQMANADAKCGCLMHGVRDLRRSHSAVRCTAHPALCTYSAMECVP